MDNCLNTRETKAKFHKLIQQAAVSIENLGNVLKCNGLFFLETASVFFLDLGIPDFYPVVGALEYYILFQFGQLEKLLGDMYSVLLVELHISGVFGPFPHEKAHGFFASRQILYFLKGLFILLGSI